MGIIYTEFWCPLRDIQCTGGRCIYFIKSSSIKPFPTAAPAHHPSASTPPASTLTPKPPPNPTPWISTQSSTSATRTPRHSHPHSPQPTSPVASHVSHRPKATLESPPSSDPPAPSSSPPPASPSSRQPFLGRFESRSLLVYNSLAGAALTIFSKHGPQFFITPPQCVFTSCATHESTSAGTSSRTHKRNHQ